MAGGTGKVGLLLVSLGTPEAARAGAVRRYLREFLMDPRVIDVPWLLRSLIVEGFILPFRPRRSAEAYRKIWTPEGSPLLVHARELVEKVRARLGEGAVVELAMRYGSPGVGGALDRLHAAGADRIVVFPLFAQNASSSWGSAVARVYREAARRWYVPALEVVDPYYDHPAFLGVFAQVARPVLESARPERVVLSFHGLPERHLIKSEPGAGGHCLRSRECCERIDARNRDCYRAQCYATARGLAALLGLEEDRWVVAFQSRLGRTPWIRPYADETIRELAESGVRRVAVLCPAFVADCLETLEEIGMRARDDFIAHGGEDLRLVPSLNSADAWAGAVVEIAAAHSSLGALATARPRGGDAS